MKRVGLCAGILLWAVCVCGLPLSSSAKAEARLFNDFLQAAYAQRQGDPARFALLQRALAQAPDSAYLKQQLVAEALVVENTRLAQPYIDFIDQAQDDPEAWTVYGAYQLQTEHPHQALQAYEKALNLNPDDERILFQYVTLLAALDPAKAAQTLTELAQSRPSFAPEIYTEIGRMYAYHQQYPQALEALDKAVSLDEKNPQPRLGRVAVYEKTNRYFLMLHELEELEKMGYTTPQTLAQMGSIFVLVKDLPRARAYFQRAKELDHADIPSNYFLALFAEEEEDFASAIGFVKDSADYKDSPAKQLQVSFYQRKLGQNQAGQDTLQLAYKRFPDDPKVAYFYGLDLYEAGAYKKSARVLAPVVEKLPDEQDIRLQYAFALEGQKKYRAMEEQLVTLLEQNPHHGGALNLWAYSLALRGERLDEAADYVARALAVDPQEYSYIDTQAWVFFRQGKYAQAADVMRAIPDEILNANPEMAYHAGMILLQTGNTAQARVYLQEAADGAWKDAQKALRKLR